MYFKCHNKQLNKDNSLFLTILNFFRQIWQLSNIVQSGRMIIVQNLALPYNVRLKIQVATDRVPYGFEVGFVLLNLQFSVQCFIDHCLSFCPFLLVIALSALLRIMTSDNTFGINKLFLSVDLKAKHISYFYGFIPFQCSQKRYL